MAPITNHTYATSQYIDGKTRNIETDRYGKTFYVDDNGNRVYINLEELRTTSIMDDKWAGVKQDCQEQQQFHAKWRDKWLALAGVANEKYKAGMETLKSTTREYTQFLSNKGCKYNELRGSEREEANQYLSDISDARRMKNRGSSDSIFYGRLAVDESCSMTDWTYMEAIADKMSEA